jgi:hypothetical protein
MSSKITELVSRFLLKFPYAWQITIVLTIISLAICNMTCLYYGFVPKLAWFFCTTIITFLFLFGGVVITGNHNPKNKMGGLYDDGQLLYPPAEVAERLVNLTIDLRHGEGTSWTQSEWDKTMKLMSNMMAHFSAGKIKQWAILLGELDTLVETEQLYTLIWEKKQKINTFFGYPNEPYNLSS